MDIGSPCMRARCLLYQGKYGRRKTYGVRLVHGEENNMVYCPVIWQTTPGGKGANEKDKAVRNDNVDILYMIDKAKRREKAGGEWNGDAPENTSETLLGCFL
jgi:hypothetical protein